MRHGFFEFYRREQSRMTSLRGEAFAGSAFSMFSNFIPKVRPIGIRELEIKYWSCSHSLRNIEP